MKCPYGINDRCISFLNYIKNIKNCIVLVKKSKAGCEYLVHVTHTK